MRIEPRKIIQIYKETRCVRRVVERLGIHKCTVYRWLKRARSPYPYGEPKYIEKGLKRKSTRPKHIRYVLTHDEKVAIEHARLERGHTAEKLKFITQCSASVSTIQRYLKRRGLIAQSTRHRRPKMQNTIHMHARNATTVGYLQMDVKYLTPELTGLPWTCFEYAIIDIYSRYKDAVILNQLDQDGAIVALIEILGRLPFRAVFVQTDNGLEFQNRFSEHAQALGMQHHHIHKSTPNENAVIERSFRTDEEEFLFWQKKPFIHYDDLRDRYAQWLRWYNYERPHLGINLKTPIQMVQSVANVVND